MTTQTVAVLGMGLAGRDLVHMLREAGTEVVLAWNRSSGLQRVADVAVHCGELPPSIDARVVVLAVSDGGIGELSRRLDRSNRLRADAALLHLSGAETSDLLRTHGSNRSCASMHPLQTLLGDGSVRRPFPWIVEGDDEAVAAASSLARALGCPVARLPADAKTRYHAAATTASNLLVALASIVHRQAAMAGLSADQVPTLFAPLMESTLAHVTARGPAGALTGPILRGDLQTVLHHLEVLGDHPEDIACYRRLSLQLVELARQRGLDSHSASAIAEALNESDRCRSRGDDYLE